MWHCTQCRAEMTFSPHFTSACENAASPACGRINRIERRACPICHVQALGPLGDRCLRCSSCRSIMPDHRWDQWDTLQFLCDLEAAGAERLEMRDADDPPR
jgi:hypothetical protein